MTALEIVARPGSRQDRVAWDGWRERWAVACRAPPTGGEANAALLRILAGHLGVPSSQLRWVRGARSRFKLLEVTGLSITEIHRRLRVASGGVSPEADSERPRSPEPGRRPLPRRQVG